MVRTTYTLLALLVMGAWTSSQAVAQISADAQLSSSNTVQITTLNSYGVRASLLYGQMEMGSLDFTHSGTIRHREPNDPWLAMDKLQHVAFSFFITTGSQYGLVNKLEIRERRALPVSAGISLLAGMSKELYDRHSRPNGFFSKRDLAADGVGIILAAGLILL